jgi:hypothetical protein
MTRTILSGFAAAALMAGLAGTRLSAQAPAATAPPRAIAAADEQSAGDTRNRLHEILNEYPPSLAQVLRLDPSLLASGDYVTPYPRLAAFLSQHPEVAHNPSFFLGDVRFSGPEPARVQTMREIRDALFGIMVFLGFAGVVGTVAYLARALIDHRRWLHASRIQTDAHTKLVERLATNEDLLAYVQSPAGQRFLSFAPALPETDVQSLSAPIGRILWSMQTGIVVAIAGLGLWVGKNYVIEEVAQPLTVVAVLAGAIGIGFVVSAIASYGLSRQLGLLRSSSHA